MTKLDTETDRYLERLGTVSASGDWEDVLGRARRLRRARVATGGAVAAVAAAVAVAALATAGGDSLLEKAQAAVLSPVRAENGTIEHVLVQYRTQAGDRSPSTRPGSERTAPGAGGRSRGSPASASPTRD